DPKGAVIPNVKISATRTSDLQSYSTSSSDEGKYGFANLPPGVYEMRFEAQGFMSTTVTNVVVSFSNIIEVNVVMTVGAATEAVTVSGGGELLQTRSASMGVNELPVNGRQLSRLR